MIVKCEACGKRIVLDSPDNQQLLLMHAMKHRTDAENFLLEFNESPITFPIQFSDVIDGSN